MMSYRFSIDDVRWPDIAITVCGGTPARIRCRTPLRRRSWTMRPCRPIAARERPDGIQLEAEAQKRSRTTQATP